MANINDYDFTTQLEEGKIDATNMPFLPGEATDYQRQLYELNTVRNQILRPRETSGSVTPQISFNTPEEQASYRAKVAQYKKRNRMHVWMWAVMSLSVFVFLLTDLMKSGTRAAGFSDWFAVLFFSALGGAVLLLPIALILKVFWKTK